MSAQDADKARLWRAGAIAIHSVNRIVFTVPELNEAERFYQAFGLDARRNGRQLDLYTHGHPHCWGSVYANGERKKLAYVSYGIFKEDLEPFRARIQHLGLGCQSHLLSDGTGLWLHDPDGVATQLAASPKVSPSQKSTGTTPQYGTPGARAAPRRSEVAQVRPRHLSHVLRFTPDVLRMVQFCTDVLGLRLSDKSRDVIAFLHSAHGSDHHLVAFAKSEAPGLHHTSWDVGSVDELGSGAEQMRMQGYSKGWGIGRHVIGSNYFYYAQDPWGSFAEYSFDIEFIPASLDWQPSDHPAEDSFYVWGPLPPDDFSTNYEAH
jgi:catechol 2,3-dioxygenase-like lactoylglutathione lyase family enzyme